MNSRDAGPDDEADQAEVMDLLQELIREEERLGLLESPLASKELARVFAPDAEEISVYDPEALVW